MKKVELPTSVNEYLTGWIELSEFWEFPVFALGLSVASFLFFALPWTWIAWKNPASWEKYRIQGKVIDVKKWFFPSLKKIIVNSSITFLSLLLLWPLLRYSTIRLSGELVWYEPIWQILIFIFLDDFVYYWMHKSFHTKWLYKNVHSVHHKPVTPCAIAGNYFHPIEFLATTTLVILWPMIFSSHIYTVYFWIIFRQWEAADGHSGYDIPWNPIKLFPFYHGPVYHDFHHKAFLGNYAGFLPFWDKIFGNYSKGYQEYQRKE